jgi:SAM-dependent methyltransferase
LQPWRAATASDPQLAGAKRFELLRCGECGTAVTVGDAPRPERMYEGGTYAPARRRLGAAIEPLRRLGDRDRMRFMHRALPAGGSVLELGAGDGKLVARLRAAGYNARGVDPSPSAAAAAARIGAPVERGDAESAQVEPASLDGVVIWHALEHLDDPAGALNRARGWLRPGGSIVIAVPDIASLQARLGGDLWFHQDVPRHRTHFTPDGMRALLGRTGFRVRAVSHVLVEQNPLGMWQTLLNRLTRERDFAFRLLKRDLGPASPGGRAFDLLITAVGGILLAPLAVAAELVAGIAGRGGTMVIEAEA